MCDAEFSMKNYDNKSEEVFKFSNRDLKFIFLLIINLREGEEKKQANVSFELLVSKIQFARELLAERNNIFFEMMFMKLKSFLAI